MNPMKRFFVIITTTAVLLLMSALMFPIESHANAIIVDTWVDELNFNGECSLREAIMNANNGNGYYSDCEAGVVGPDSIWLGDHVYTLDIEGIENYNYSGDLDITDDLTINGSTSLRPTIIEAGSTDPRFGGCSDCDDRVFHITNSSYVTFVDLTIRHGNPPDGGVGIDGSLGGGILNQGNLELKDCSVIYNRAGDGLDGDGGDGGFGGGGGGIANLNSLKLTRTEVLFNRAGDGGQGDDSYKGGAGGWGGGVHSDVDSELYIDHSTISNNEAGNGGRGGDTEGGDAGNGRGGGGGGGINCLYCFLSIDYSTILDNFSGAGGDGGNVNSGDGNGGTGGNGGGGAGILINGDSADSTITHSSIGNNHTGVGGSGGSGSGTGTDGADGFRGNGGGFFLVNSADPNTLKTSTVYNNTAGEGGGIYLSDDSVMSINHSTISGNGSDGAGGGIRATGTGTLALSIYVTITDNTATNGGGFYNSNDGSISLWNTIIYGNTGGLNPDCFGAVTTMGNNLLGVNSKGCGFTAAMGDLVGESPNLGNLNDNGGPTLTHAIRPPSAAIDHIYGGTCGTTDKYDQRGIIRYEPCDIGAYEYDQATYIYLPLILR